MINRNDNPVEWTFLLDELEEARGHLADVIAAMATDSTYDEATFAVGMGHIMAHLNRAWASRNIDRELNDEEWEAFREYQHDLRPIA